MAFLFKSKYLKVAFVFRNNERFIFFFYKEFCYTIFFMELYRKGTFYSDDRMIYSHIRYTKLML